MNLLSLCQAAQREMGVSGSGPATAVNATGFAAKVVAWVQQASSEIQGKHPTWRFLWRQTDLALTQGKQVYARQDFGQPNIKVWRGDGCNLYRPIEGPNARYWPAFMSWMDYQYLTRQYSAQGMPQYVAERPDLSLSFFPVPDGDYVFSAEYYVKPIPLVKNTDVPLMPEEFHMIIAWRAVMFYAGSDSDPGLLVHAAAQYSTLMSAMEMDQLDPMEMAGAEV